MDRVVFYVSSGVQAHGLVVVVVENENMRDFMKIHLEPQFKISFIG